MCFVQLFRSMEELFKSCRQRETIRYTMKVSMVEIYNEAIFDLLVQRNEGGTEKLQIQKKGKDINIPVRAAYLKPQRPPTDVCLPPHPTLPHPPPLHPFPPPPTQGLIEIEVCSLEDVLMLMREGEKNRTVASTKMNTNR